MDLKNSAFYIRKILFTFAVLLVFYGIFRLNVKAFYEMKTQAENVEISNSEHDNFKQANTGIMFVDEAKNTAIFLFPDTDYKYDTKQIFAEYKASKNLNLSEKLLPDTIYHTKTNTSCLVENNCDKSLDKIIELAQKYNMIPKSYDLTDMIISKNGDNL